MDRTPGSAKPMTDDPDAPPSEGELAAAVALRDALDDPARAHEGAALLRAVAEAHAPRAIDEAEHDAIVARAVARMPAARTSRPRARALAFGFGAALALAAGLVLVARGRDDGPADAPAAVLARARSTQPLFDEPFARSGARSARIDRIARARSADLRDNRFAMRGVR